jgi:hypothetical protein
VYRGLPLHLVISSNKTPFKSFCLSSCSVYTVWNETDQARMVTKVKPALNHVR